MYTPEIDPGKAPDPTAALKANPIGAGLRFGGGVFGGLASGMRDKRQARNQNEMTIAESKNLDPNMRLDAAFDRNTRGNFRENIGNYLDSLGPGGIGGGGAAPGDFQRGLAEIYLQSISKGINPMLMDESRNIAGIPGLSIGGQEIAPDVRPDIKGPGIGEIMSGGLASLFGG